MNAEITRPPVRRRQPPGRMPWPVEWPALAALLLIIGLLCAGYAWFRQNLAGPPQLSASQTDPQSGLSREAAAAIVGRGSELLGYAGPADIWTERLVSGQSSLGDYLLRVFTSPAYLAGQADDRTFLADASLVLTGSMISEPDLAAAEASLDATGSRLQYLNEIMQKQKYSGAISLSGDPTRLRTFTLANDRLPAGQEIAGLMPINSEARLTGRAARFRLFADGRLRESMPVVSNDPTILNQYTIEWDTRQEIPGRHELSLLIQTSDGRGTWLDLEDYLVPEIRQLATGEILAGEISAGRSAWYQMPANSTPALLTLFDAETNNGTGISLQLLDLYNRPLVSAASVDGQPAALRYRPDPLRPADAALYVRIEPNLPDDGQAVPASQAKIHFMLAAAWAAARPAASPERLLSVLERRGDEVLIRDANGAASWQQAEDYQLIDATASLGRLSLRLPSGNTIPLGRTFLPDETGYAAYVDGGTSQLELAALTMEGSAAGLQIERLAESGAKLILKPGEPVPLEYSENRLHIIVTGFDGSSRTYEVNILRPPHSAGFHLTLDRFPESYRSPLWLLHLQKPAWQFLAEPAGLSWPAFIDAQDERDRSLVEADSSPASWVEAGSPVYDGSSWKAADRRIIEYFADPRNFLNDIDIFQFERLTYEPAAQNRAGVEAILRDTFMAADSAGNIDYAGLLLAAGEKAGISPYFLAAKIIQEMGRNGESPLATGRLAGYEGIYNFYNIGSTPDPKIPNGAVINGARFALFGREADQGEITPDEARWLLPWQSPARAITGGAIWIAERYVLIGQDTLYLQKFDLIAGDGLYQHQYAQNIQMAWAEARRSRKAYAGLGLLDQAYVFRIPVFNGLPDTPQTLPRTRP